MRPAAALLLLALVGAAQATSRPVAISEQPRLQRSERPQTSDAEPAAASLGHGAASGSSGQSWLPIVMWHGMGDSCCSTGFGAVKTFIEATLPGVFVHSIATARSPMADLMGSYFGNLNEQVDRVCDELMGMEELKDGYVAVGFSQGGQFLRAVLQRCQHLGPRMHTLVTLGSQHQGVMSVPGCPQPDPAGEGPPFYCRLMQGLIGRGAYAPWVQSHVVQAQYVKDPYHLDLYLTHSIFLADINGEVPGRLPPARYRENLASLQRLVLFQFDDDDMVVPKESAHFGFFNGSALLAMRDTPLYQQDWIGLKALDEADRLTMLHTPGRHMRFSLDWFEQHVVRPWLAVPAAETAAAGERVEAR
ncbi:hypothetical protein ABPG75_005520 [Micractinium tetrahymenae]